MEDVCSICSPTLPVSLATLTSPDHAMYSHRYPLTLKRYCRYALIPPATLHSSGALVEMFISLQPLPYVGFATA